MSIRWRAALGLASSRTASARSFVDIYCSNGETFQTGDRRARIASRLFPGNGPRAADRWTAVDAGDDPVAPVDARRQTAHRVSSPEASHRLDAWRSDVRDAGGVDVA